MHAHAQDGGARVRAGASAPVGGDPAADAGVRVFLDLDGTLTDPREGITRSIRYALARLGRPAPPDADLTWCIGPPLQDSFAVLLGHDAALVARAVALYRERFGAVGILENLLHTGIEDALSRLSARGARLYVATSKPRVYARRIVARFGLWRWIAEVFGAELDGRLARKRDLLAHALAATGGRRAPAVMVGDRRHDVHGAAANGLPTVAVLWGFGDRAELSAAGADALIAAPVELVAAVWSLAAPPRR